jgi:hypothetical protein
MSTRKVPSLKKQAEIFANYLVRQPPPKKLVEIFIDSIEADADNTDTFLLLALTRPCLLPYLDAYSELFRPTSLLRQRLYLMCAILEASPHYVDYFLPRKRSPFYIFMLPILGLRALYRLTVGIMIAKVYSLR